ncbi:hypothetical protein EDC04DRAFT_201515 [Pisolithus marmoratus]|nr:hypothetical protein EDC04DRAFT_201515 [Pisolithus marmoratus]
MKLATFFPLVLAAVANAHFQLLYPAPRGPFVGAQEPMFCGGYPNPVDNRTVFPLSNGVINLNSTHESWTIGVIVSTKQDPTSWSDFLNSSTGFQTVVKTFQTVGAGKYCFPINLAASGVAGIQDGANVTIQVVYGSSLYQCADLTLSASAAVPSNATSTCTNATVINGTAPAPASTPTHTGGAKKDGVVASGVFATALISLGLSFF